MCIQTLARFPRRVLRARQEMLTLLEHLIPLMFCKGVRGFQTFVLFVFVLSFSLFQICLVSLDYELLISLMVTLQWTWNNNRTQIIFTLVWPFIIDHHCIVLFYFSSGFPLLFIFLSISPLNIAYILDNKFYFRVYRWLLWTTCYFYCICKWQFWDIEPVNLE